MRVFSSESYVDSLAGFRRVTFEELVAILRRIDGMPAEAVGALARSVWSRVPPHPRGRRAWAQAATSLKLLAQWLASESLIDDQTIDAVHTLLKAAARRDGKPRNAREAPLWRMKADSAQRRHRKSDYEALVTDAVDILR